VANATAGETYKVIGQADRFVTRVISETSAYYQLGVQVPPGTGGNRYLNTNVSVRRSGVTVRTFRHAIQASARPDQLSVDEALRARVTLGGMGFGVPFRTTTVLRRDGSRADSPLQLLLNVEVPKAITGPLAMMFNVIDPAGKIIAAGRKDLIADGKDDLRATLPIAVPAGTYRLRVALADAYANVGAIEREVDAHLTRAGPVSVSELSLSWTDATGTVSAPVFDMWPTAAKTLRVRLDLYADKADEGSSVVVRLGLLRADTGAIVAERDVPPTSDASGLNVTASLPADSVEPGPYRVRAVILAGGIETGVVSTVIHKGS
jgi:hypothetical protein